MLPNAARLVTPLALSALACASAAAQQPVRTALAAPDAAFPRSFKSVAAVRELSDGRLIVLDVDDRVVSLVDIGAGTAAPLGRSSAPAAEYVFPVALLKLAGDTTLIVDPAGQRLVPVLGDGRTVAPIPIPDHLRLGQWRGADAQGRLYMQMRPGGMGGGPQAPQPDSLIVVRWDRASGATDTVARVKAPATMMVSDGMMQMVRPRPLAAVDDWAVAPDGALGIARSADYHVEWLRGGTATKGAAVSYEPVPVAPADVEAVNRIEANPRGRIVTGPNGQPSMQEMPPPPVSAASDFPKVKPPFHGASAHVAPDGSLWVRRSRAAEDAPMYDVFDGSGAHVRQVTLPIGSRIAAIGARGIYLERIAEGGARLERHPVP